MKGLIQKVSATHLMCMLGGIIVSTKLFTKGMFMDGTIYASVSRNLSIGQGSFWEPYYTAGSHTQFHEHPPLFFGIQSLFFNIFGDHLFVERLFDLIIYLLSLWMVVKIWNLLTKNPDDAWKPILLLIFIPDFIWTHQNNMLEALMGLFLLIGAFYGILSVQRNQVLYTGIAGFMIFLAFFTKGFTALYLWGMFAALYLLDQNISFLKALINTLFIFIFTVVPFGLLWMVPAANESLSIYFENQVLGSIENVSTVDSRFYIVTKFLENLIIPGVILTIGYLIQRKKTTLQLNTSGWAWIIIALFGVLPIMISMKQRGFYIATVYPFAALGLAVVFGQLLAAFKWSFWTQKAHIIKPLLLVAFVATPIIAYQFIGRDQTKFQLTYTVESVIAPRKSINASPRLMQDYGLNAYFMRLHKISLVSLGQEKLDFILTQKEQDMQNHIDSEKYFLYAP